MHGQEDAKSTWDTSNTRDKTQKTVTGETGEQKLFTEFWSIITNDWNKAPENAPSEHDNRSETLECVPFSLYSDMKITADGIKLAKDPQTNDEGSDN
jgi:hypothetical protein